MTGDHDLIDFVRQTLKTIWAIEMLLMMQAAPDRRWSVGELVGELRASEPLVNANLDLFQRAGLVAPHEGGLFQFGPVSDDLATFCADLAILYRERPHAVRAALLSPADRLQELADAFKIRRKPE